MLTGLPVVWCQSDCDTVQVIGNNDNTEYTEAIDSMVYLNLNNPAQCNGTISAYQYCHYPTTETGGGVRFNAILAVFRREGNFYQSVTGSDVVLEVVTTLGFTCSTVNVTPMNGIQIEPGDALGACVGRMQINNDSFQQLNLAGDSGINDFFASSVPVSECSSITDSVATDNLSQLSGRMLHLAAEFSELLVFIGSRSCVLIYSTVYWPPTHCPPTHLPPTHWPPTH